MNKDNVNQDDLQLMKALAEVMSNINKDICKIKISGMTEKNIQYTSVCHLAVCMVGCYLDKDDSDDHVDYLKSLFNKVLDKSKFKIIIERINE